MGFWGFGVFKNEFTLTGSSKLNKNYTYLFKSRTIEKILDIYLSKTGGIRCLLKYIEGASNIEVFHNDHSELAQTMKKALFDEILKNNEKSGGKALKKAASDSTLKNKNGVLDDQELQKANETLVKENQKLKKERDSMKNKLQTLIIRKKESNNVILTSV